KPSPVMLRGARKELGLTTDQTVVIGDTMETDILGGVQLGFKTILVLSGGTRRADLDRYAYQPDLIVDSIAELDHADIAANLLPAVEPLDGGLRLGVGPHLDEAEPLGAVRVPIDDDLGALHRAELGEQRLQLGLVDVVGQVAHVQLLAHDRTPERKTDDPLKAF